MAEYYFKKYELMIESGHEGFWFMGGNLALARIYSRFLALQIKAVELGLVDEKNE